MWSSQYVPVLTDSVKLKHPSEDEEELDAVRRSEIKRSSADKHKIDLLKRKRNKRKRPTLPLHYELTAFEASLLQLQQKLAQVLLSRYLEVVDQFSMMSVQ